MIIHSPEDVLRWNENEERRATHTYLDLTRKLLQEMEGEFLVLTKPKRRVHSLNYGWPYVFHDSGPGVVQEMRRLTFLSASAKDAEEFIVKSRQAGWIDLARYQLTDHCYFESDGPKLEKMSEELNEEEMMREIFSRWGFTLHTYQYFTFRIASGGDGREEEVCPDKDRPGVICPDEAGQDEREDDHGGATG